LPVSQRDYISIKSKKCKHLNNHYFHGNNETNSPEISITTIEPIRIIAAPLNQNI